MALHSIHAQIAAIEAAAKASPENGALVAAAKTLREVVVACAPGWRIESCPCCGTNWHVEAWRPPTDRLTRAMEGLMP